MVHSDFFWYEMRAVGKKQRNIVPVQYIQNEVDDLGSRPTNVHLSIFRYSNAIKEYRERNGNRVKGFTGSAYANYVPIDIDAPGLEDLDQAVETARTIVGEIREWGLAYEDVAVYYSGRRGFHILIPTLHFAKFDPDPKFHDLLFEIVVELFKDGPLIRTAEMDSSTPVIESEDIDFGPYTRLHMLRMPGTIHEKTELWKIPVREGELMGGTAEEAAAAIKRAAETDRPTYRPDPEPTEETARLGDSLKGRMSEGGELKYRKRSGAVSTMNLNDHLTADDMRDLDKPGYGRFAVEARRTMKVLAGGLSEGESIENFGGRHDALCHLVGKMKNQFDLPRDWTEALLRHWNQSNEDPLPEREFRTVIRDLYN